MTLAKWNPARSLVSPEREIERFFNGLWNQAYSGDTCWRPSVDLAESEDAYELTVEIPGMKKEDIQIKYQDKVLTLSGERRQEEEKKGKSYSRVERSYGRFERSFWIPADVKADAIKARYADGVLTIEVPKSEKAKPQEIRIN